MELTAPTLTTRSRSRSRSWSRSRSLSRSLSRPQSRIIYQSTTRPRTISSILFLPFRAPTTCSVNLAPGSTTHHFAVCVYICIYVRMHVWNHGGMTDERRAGCQHVTLPIRLHIQRPRRDLIWHSPQWLWRASRAWTHCLPCMHTHTEPKERPDTHLNDCEWRVGREHVLRLARKCWTVKNEMLAPAPGQTCTLVICAHAHSTYFVQMWHRTQIHTCISTCGQNCARHQGPSITPTWHTVPHRDGVPCTWTARLCPCIMLEETRSAGKPCPVGRTPGTDLGGCRPSTSCHLAGMESCPHRGSAWWMRAWRLASVIIVITWERVAWSHVGICCMITWEYVACSRGNMLHDHVGICCMIITWQRTKLEANNTYSRSIITSRAYFPLSSQDYSTWQ